MAGFSAALKRKRAERSSARRRDTTGNWALEGKKAHGRRGVSRSWKRQSGVPVSSAEKGPLVEPLCTGKRPKVRPGEAPSSREDAGPRSAAVARQTRTEGDRYDKCQAVVLYGSIGAGERRRCEHAVCLQAERSSRRRRSSREVTSQGVGERGYRRWCCGNAMASTCHTGCGSQDLRSRGDPTGWRDCWVQVPVREHERKGRGTIRKR